MNKTFIDKLAKAPYLSVDKGDTFSVSFETDDVNRMFSLIMVPPIEDVLQNVFGKFGDVSSLNRPMRYPTIGPVIEYPEKGIREAVLSIPLSYFVNTTYRPYLEDYEEKIKLQQIIHVHVTAAVGHPFYNYLDEGNKVITRFKLAPNGTVFTSVGKSGDNFQYAYFIAAEVDCDSYNEAQLLNPYKKKIKEIHSAINNEGSPGMYKGTNITGSFAESPTVLFEFDFATNTDLLNISPREVVAYSKVRETNDSSQQVLVQLTTMGEGDKVSLRSGLELYRDYVMYAGQKLYSSYIGTADFLFNTKKAFPNFSRFTPVVENVYVPYLKSSPTASIEDLDWDTYLESFVKYLWIKSTTHDDAIDILIGDVSISLKYFLSTGVFHVNGKRINKDEVVPVLMKALCSNTQESYTTTLDVISKTSLEMHQFIREGLNIQISFNDMPSELKNYLTYEDIRSYMSLSFKIARDKGINYIELGDEFVKIKDSRKLMDLRAGKVNYSELTKIFGEGTVVLEKPIHIQNQMATVIEAARKKYIEAFNKSKELLEFSLEQLGAEIITFKGVKGVRVTGRSGNQYFIEADNLGDPMKGEPRCTVYLYPSHTHICIVDKNNGVKQVGLDKLVARMYALYNDSFLTSEIHTLKTHVNT